MPKILRVLSQGIWKILELFRFPHISTIFNVDFHVDFKQKKFPDAYGHKKNLSIYKCPQTHELTYKSINSNSKIQPAHKPIIPYKP
jgi:hypothetical protein